MPIKKVNLVLNTDDPEQTELYDFVTKLPNGKKRNASGFLRTLLDREYQRYKQEKKTQEASRKGTLYRSEKGGIKYTLPNQLND
jgi:hypothetical protein